MKRFLICALALGLLAGCDDAALTGSGTGSQVPVAAKPAPSGQSVIYLYRANQLAASANAISVYVDEAEVAQMTVGTVHQQVVAAGTRTVRVETTPSLLNVGLALALQARPALAVAAGSGGVAYLELTVRELDGSPQIRQVDAATAAAATRGFTTAKAL